MGGDNIIPRFLRHHKAMQERALNDVPVSISKSVYDINRILNYPDSAKNVMVFGHRNVGKSMVIDQLGYHINDIPCINGAHRDIMYPTSRAILGFRKSDDDSLMEFVSQLNDVNADRHIIVVCDRLDIALAFIRMCPTTSIILEMEENDIMDMMDKDQSIINMFEPIHMIADMSWGEAVHEIQQADKRFALKSHKTEMSMTAVKTFALELMRMLYPSRKSIPSFNEHIDVPIGYIISQLSFAYAKSMERPYKGHDRITPRMARSLAMAAFDNDPGDLMDDVPALTDEAIADDDKSPMEDVRDDDFSYKDITSLADRLKRRIFHQDAAIDMLVSSIMIDAAGLNRPHHPVASFIFVGPSGVGKTELAKALSQEISELPMNIIRIDCSEFSEQHTASRLFGAPPGYKGYGPGGELTNAVRRNPHSIILLDEAEKANRNIWNTFLQVLDDARLTDSSGRTVDFSKCIFIMTSNLGAMRTNESSMGFTGAFDDHGDMYIKAVTDYFKPEFINRLDGICVFNQLDNDDYKRIIQVKMKSIESSIMTNTGNSIGINAHDSAIDVILKYSDSMHCGARMVDSTIRRMIVLPLSRKILQKDINFRMINMQDKTCH